MRRSGQQKMWHIYLTPTFETIVYCTLHEEVGVDSSSAMQPLADESFSPTPGPVHIFHYMLQNRHLSCSLHPAPSLSQDDRVSACDSGSLGIQLKKKGMS